MRLTGAILKQSNSTVQIWPSPWLNLRRKPELDLLPLELDFLYGWDDDKMLQRIKTLHCHLMKFFLSDGVAIVLPREVGLGGVGALSRLLVAAPQRRGCFQVGHI